MNRRLPLLGLLLVLLLVDQSFLAAQPAAPAPVPAAMPEEEDSAEETAVEKPDPSADKFWEAIGHFRNNKPDSQTAGRTALQAASDLEFTAAQVLLGECLMSGSYGFKKDLKRGANLYLLAAERGSAYAMVNLGQCYHSGVGVRRNEEKAVQWFTAALTDKADYSRPNPPVGLDAQQAGAPTEGLAGGIASDPAVATLARARYFLGVIETTRKNFPAAHEHHVAAALAGPNGRDGIYEAAVQAALNYAFGQGTPRDPAKAGEMLDHSRAISERLAANIIQTYVALKLVDDFAAAEIEETLASGGGETQSQLQFGIARQLAGKKSKEYNPAEALRWYELAAGSGQVWAMLSLGLAYTDGSLGPADPTKAFHWFEKAGSGDRPKHYLATANLAISHLHGFGTPKDPAKAAEIFQKHRDASFLCHLGSVGQAPATIQTYEQMMSTLEAAAKRRDPAGQYFMGRRHQEGWDGPVDFNKALDWYKKAGKANHAGALCKLGVLYESLPAFMTGMESPAAAKKTAGDCYRQGADLGHVESMVNYATTFINGSGVAVDLPRAQALLEKALKLEPTHPRAHNNLGSIHEQRLRDAVARDSARLAEEPRRLMLEHFERSAELKFHFAAHNLGRIHFEGRLVSRDYGKAYRYFDEAAAGGQPLAHYELGLMHELGLGLPVTFTEAAYHYRLAALAGHADSLRRLIDFYLSGRGVSIDFNRAAFWLERMAQMGHQRALLVIADIMIAKQEYDGAFRLLKQLAGFRDDYISGFANERLSRCYQNGWGVKKSEPRAKKCFDLAIAKGDCDALTILALQQISENKTTEALATFHRASARSGAANYFLGQMYFFGTNVEKDEERGIKHMRAAATRNHLKALYFLAAAHFNRLPGAPGLDEAILFATQAEQGGHPEAADLRTRLEKRRETPSPAVEKNAPARSI